jgi:Protein of unknown function (DUF559)
MSPGDATVLRNVPVTSVCRTLVDLAAVAGRREVERALNEAEVRDLARVRELPAFLARCPRRPGTATLRSIVAGQRLGITRSELEDLFVAFVDDAGLPRPLLNQRIRVNGRDIEVDCLWPGRRVIVELDGQAAHRTARAFENDRARDRALTAAGWRPVRVTWRQLMNDRLRLGADLRAVLG